MNRVLCYFLSFNGHKNEKENKEEKEEEENEKLTVSSVGRGLGW